jgi:hypothetical protein
MAKRYDQKKKDEVVAFIQKYNKENGRGGQSAAVKKYKLNPITVRNWLESAGVPTAGKSAKKRKTSGKASPATKPVARKATSRKSKSRKTPSRKASASKAAPASVSATLKRMMQVQEQIEALSSEYDALKKSL